MKQFYRYIKDNKDILSSSMAHYVKAMGGNSENIQDCMFEKPILYVVEHWLKNKDVKGIRDLIKLHILWNNENQFSGNAKLDFMVVLKAFKWGIRDLIPKYEPDNNKNRYYYGYIEKMFDDIEIILYVEGGELSKGDIKFKALAETMGSSMYIVHNNKFRFVNSYFIKSIGYKKEELYKLNCWDIVHPDHRKFIKDRCLNDFKNDEDKVSNYEIKILTKDGKEKWVNVNISNISLGDVSVAIGVAIDTSNKKIMQKELEVVDKKLGSIMKTINVGVEILTNGKVSYVNTFMARITGYSREELLNINMQDIVHPSFKNAMEELMILSGEVHKDNIREELKIVKKNGEEVWVDVRESNVDIADDRYSILCFNDITESKIAQQRLKMNQEKYKNLLEVLPEGVLLEKEHKIVYANNSALQMCGYKTFDDIINNKLSELLMSNSCKENLVKNEANKSLDDKKIFYTGEKTFIRKIDGKALELDVKSSWHNVEGCEVMMVILKDISHRNKIQMLKKNMEIKNKEIKEIQECDKLKTQFFSNISHEIRTPLNVILGSMQLLKLMVQSEDLNEYKSRMESYLSVIKRNAFRLVRLTNNLIDATQIESGYFSMNLDNYDVVGLTRSITDSVRKYAYMKNINLYFKTELDKKMIVCDYPKLERIVLNILSNAVKFTPKRGEIKVKIYNGVNNTIISIIDNGIGIPKDKQKLIFGRFMQVDKSLSRNTEGAGMGLSIAKALVEMQGGKIYLESELGKGSEFKIIIPDRELRKRTLNLNNRIEPFGIEKVDIEFSDVYA